MKCRAENCGNQVKTEGALCIKCLDKLEYLIDEQYKSILLYVCPVCNSVIKFAGYPTSSIRTKIAIINIKCNKCEETQYE